MNNVLIVGAGAVGQAYGYHLYRAGCRVTFFVRAHHVENLTSYPLTLHRLFMFGKSQRNEWREFSVASTEEQVRAGADTWDAVIFTAPQDALRRDNFAANFTQWVGQRATIVVTSSGFGDLELFRDEIGVSKDRLVYNMISSINWQAPIPNERWQPVPPATGPNAAIAYLAPSALPFDGPLDRVRPIVDAFNRGGLAATIQHDLKASVSSVDAPFNAILVALEACDWSFDTLRHSPLLDLATKAGDEALVIAAKKNGTPPSSMTRWLLGPWFVGSLIWLAPRLMPFDFERYIKYHFTKVGEQVFQVNQAFIEQGKALGLPVANLQKLTDSNPRYHERTAAASSSNTNTEEK